MESIDSFEWDYALKQPFSWEDIQKYKYRTKADYQIVIPIFCETIKTDFLELDPTGLLTIRKWYAWDGASGPTKDTKKSKRGSCVHDALYQLMRSEHLDYRVHREIADEVFYQILLADKMWRFRALCWFLGVRRHAEFAARPKGK